MINLDLDVFVNCATNNLLQLQNWMSISRRTQNQSRTSVQNAVVPFPGAVDWKDICIVFTSEIDATVVDFVGLPKRVKQKIMKLCVSGIKTM